MARQLKKILIAEDDIEFREKLRRDFEARGVSTRGVRTGVDLLLEFNETFDALLVDTEMPVLTGPLACQILRQRASLDGILIVGMSYRTENRALWKNVTPHFYSKPELEELDLVSEFQRLYP